MNVTDLPEHVAAKIEPDPVTGCWLWLAQISPEGYGRIKWARRPAYAHRVVFHLLADRLTPVHPGGAHAGLQLDHLCCVRNCVNPAHLEPVTDAENMRRAAARRPRPVKFIKRRKPRPLALAVDDQRHGTPNGYRKWGCRCEPCRVATTKYARERREARRLVEVAS